MLARGQCLLSPLRDTRHLQKASTSNKVNCAVRWLPDIARVVLFDDTTSAYYMPNQGAGEWLMSRHKWHVRLGIGHSAAILK